MKKYIVKKVSMFLYNIIDSETNEVIDKANFRIEAIQTVKDCYNGIAVFEESEMDGIFEKRFDNTVVVFCR